MADRVLQKLYTTVCISFISSLQHADHPGADMAGLLSLDHHHGVISICTIVARPLLQVPQVV
jgi:hypothetical protein